MMHVELQCNPLELPRVTPSPAVIEARDYILGWYRDEFDDRTVAQLDMNSDNSIFLRLIGAEQFKRIPLHSPIGEALLELRHCHINAISLDPRVRPLAGTYQVFVEGENVRLAKTDAPHVDIGSPCIMRYTDGNICTEGYRGLVRVLLDDTYFFLPLDSDGLVRRRDALNAGLARISDEEFMKLQAIQAASWVPMVFGHLRDIHQRRFVPQPEGAVRMVGSFPTDYSRIIP